MIFGKSGSPHWNRDSILRIPQWRRDIWFLQNILKLTWLPWTSYLPVAYNNFKCESGMNTRELKWLSLRQAGYLPKIKPRFFTSCLNRAYDRAKFDYWGERKNYYSSVSIVWWHGYRDSKGFSKQSPWRYWPKKLFILTSWGTGKTLMLIESCWSKSSNLLPNYPSYWELIGRF